MATQTTNPSVLTIRKIEESRREAAERLCGQTPRGTDFSDPIARLHSHLSSLPNGSLVDKMREALDLQEAFAQAGKFIATLVESYEAEAQRRMESEGVTQIKGAYLTVSMSEKVHPVYDPERWDEIVKFLGTHGLSYFVQRRLTAAKIEEALVAGTHLPRGVGITYQNTVSTRRSGKLPDGT